MVSVDKKSVSPKKESSAILKYSEGKIKGAIRTAYTGKAHWMEPLCRFEAVNYFTRDLFTLSK